MAIRTYFDEYEEDMDLPPAPVGYIWTECGFCGLPYTRPVDGDRECPRCWREAHGESG